MTPSREAGYRFLTFMVVLLFIAVSAQSVALYRLLAEQNDSKPVEASRLTVVDPPPSPATSAPGAGRDADGGFDHDIRSLFDHPMFDRDLGAWNPHEEMLRMRERMERIFGETMNRMRATPDWESLLRDFSFSPDMDLHEEPDRYVVRFNIPGADKSQVRVELQDRMLTVSGTTADTRERLDGDRALQLERRQGRFQRSISLPGPVDSSRLEAVYDKGVLVVTVPKLDTPTPPRRVDVI